MGLGVPCGGAGGGTFALRDFALPEIGICKRENGEG